MLSFYLVRRASPTGIDTRRAPPHVSGVACGSIMRQLTAVDAQFLDMEDARNLGHVSFLTVVDPSTAPGGRLDVSDLCRLVGERLDRLPPFRWKLAPVPFAVARPFWVDDP